MSSLLMSATPYHAGSRIDRPRRRGLLPGELAGRRERHVQAAAHEVEPRAILAGVEVVAVLEVAGRGGHDRGERGLVGAADLLVRDDQRGELGLERAPLGAVERARPRPRGEGLALDR